MKILFEVITLCLVIPNLSLGQVEPPVKELNANYWNGIGANDVAETIMKFNSLNTNKAKNVILFIGDGMSLSSVVAGRMRKAQKRNPAAPGEEEFTSLDKMPHSGIMKTYSVSHQTPDSAATATAFLCGIKTRSGMLGVSASASSRRCGAAGRHAVTSVLENAAAIGKSTGIVTTTRVQHATPAGSYAKSPSRGWYSDGTMPAYAKRQRCEDIASQLVSKNKMINVILGGGRAHMKPSGARDEEYSQASQSGDRKDRRNLIKEWLDGKRGSKASYVWNKKQFDNIDPASTDYLMGLFEPFEMHYSLDRPFDRAGEPSLPEMTKKAIQILQKNKQNGYFLLVESGLIDKAHHKALAHYALEEFLELEKSVETAKNLTDDSDTLIIVTADHGHVFTIGGGTAIRGNPVLGLSPSNKRPRKAKDGKFYTSSGYANGPGGFSPNPRPSLTKESVAYINHRFQAAVPLPAESHSSEDVVAFASGPMSHMITGVHEQNFIAHMINYASCTGNYEESTAAHCEKINPEKTKFRRTFDASMDEIMNPQPWEDPSVF